MLENRRFQRSSTHVPTPKLAVSAIDKLLVSSTMEFEWDEPKAASNLRKHGVDFETAKQVFADPFAVDAFDPLSADYGEDRFVITGYGGGRLLTVTYTLRDETIRLISARKATRKEHDDYQGESPQI
jgi:uncharacterized protein